MELITSVSYSFIHNGSVFEDVVPQRGLRQGDPISSYIYILCAEGLSAIIGRNEEAGLLHGCSIARGSPAISHLLFVDDCYFFFRATKVEADIMKRILSRYEEVSGQMINKTKSTILFSPNRSAENRRAVCDQLGVNMSQHPGKYLGLPMEVGRRKTTTFSFLAERVQQNLNGWHNQHLSKVGKVICLKTAAQVTPNSWMNIFLILAVICDTVEKKKMNAFWWGICKKNRGIKWMSSDRLC